MVCDLEGMHGDSEPRCFVLRPQAPLDQEQEQLLEERGWGYFKVLVGPAAGPRNFITMGLDRHISNLARSTAAPATPTWLVGGSFAALRNCAIITHSTRRHMHDPPDTPTEQLLRGFSNMVYRPGFTSAMLAEMMRELYALAAPAPREILAHPHLRVAIFVTSLQPWTHYVADWQLKFIFYLLLGANVVSSSVLNTLQKRLCFYSGPDPPPFLDPASVTCVPLTEANLHQVLHATTCLPFVSERCTYIDGLGPGIYYDGALGDYCMNFTSTPDLPVLCLSMDWEDTPIKMNIWDIFVPWRYATPEMLRHVTVLSPTRKAQAMLPGGALPNTWDFFKKEYMADPEKRIKAWITAFEVSCRGIPDHPRQLMPTRTHHLVECSCSSCMPGGVGACGRKPCHVRRDSSSSDGDLVDPEAAMEKPVGMEKEGSSVLEGGRMSWWTLATGGWWAGRTGQATGRLTQLRVMQGPCDAASCPTAQPGLVKGAGRRDVLMPVKQAKGGLSTYSSSSSLTTVSSTSDASAAPLK